MLGRPDTLAELASGGGTDARARVERAPVRCSEGDSFSEGTQEVADVAAGLGVLARRLVDGGKGTGWTGHR